MSRAICVNSTFGEQLLHVLTFGGNKLCYLESRMPVKCNDIFGQNGSFIFPNVSVISNGLTVYIVYDDMPSSTTTIEFYYTVEVIMPGE